MRTLTKEPPHHPTGTRTDTEQDISTQQRRKGHNPLLMRRRSHRNGGGRVKFNNPTASVILSSAGTELSIFDKNTTLANLLKKTNSIKEITITRNVYKP